MSKVKLDLDGLKPTEAVAKGRNLVTMQTGNPLYATPVPPLSSITDAANVLEAAYNAALHRDSQMVAIRREKQEILENLMRANAVYVQFTSGSNADNIISAGWDVQASSNNPIGPLPPAQGVKVSNVPGFSGQLNLDWAKVRGCNSFVVKRSVTPTNPESFQQIGISTKSSFVDTAAEPGTLYFYTVTSVGPLGLGGVSEIANGRAL